MVCSIGCVFIIMKLKLYKYVDNVMLLLWIVTSCLFRQVIQSLSSSASSVVTCH